MSEHDAVDTVELPNAPAPAHAPRTASSVVQVDIGASSNPGKVRATNEDHFLVARAERSLRTLLTNLPPGDLPEETSETAYGMLIADGMGGMAAGEVASRTAISTLVGTVVRDPDWILRFDEASAPDVLARTAERFHAVHGKLMELAERDPNLAGMGTTMTVACSFGADLLIAHVGDSRAYLLRDGRLHRLTSDHTLVQSLLDAGSIGREELRTHPMRHVLTKAIDTRPEDPPVDLKRSRLVDGDQLLLCTDGLTEMVADEAIVEVLQSRGSAMEACRALVDVALRNGGKDNVTVVLARYRIPA